MNSLKSDAQPFSKLTASHRPIQSIKQTPSTRTKKCATTQNSIRNCLESTISSARGEMPPIDLTAPGKSEFLQSFKRRCCFLEIKLRLYRNFSLGLFAESKCDKTSRLRFGQIKTPSFGIHSGSPLDSGKAIVRPTERQRTGISSNDPQPVRPIISPRYPPPAAAQPSRLPND